MKLNDLKYKGMFQPDALINSKGLSIEQMVSKNQAAKKIINKRKKKGK